MSGIFGFTYQTDTTRLSEQTLGGLEYWNRSYGREAGDTALWGASGIGCHIEHFSDRFPYGGPLLYFEDSVAVIDALLFNREELEQRLGVEDRISDEELLLKLIRDQGFDALAGVNGDFAGAIFDRKTNSWTLFRDHLGVRPLYVYHDSRLFAFSTDIRGLTAIPGADLKLHELRFYTDVIGFNSLSLQDTEFLSIRCALPGAVTRVTPRTDGFSLEESPYWRIRSKKIRLADDADYTRRMKELITDSVNRRLDAIPGLIGAELSGGLDSSVIDILINRHGRRGCYFSWSNDPQVLPLRDAEDERRVIFDICDQEGIECHFLTAKDKAGHEKMLRQGMPPFADTPQLGFGSAWMHRQGARVVFTGHGGDEGVSHRANRFELFYNREFLAYFRLYWKDFKGKPLRLLRTLRTGLLDALARWRQLTASAPEAAYDSPVLQRSFQARMRGLFRDQRMYFFFAPEKYVMQGGTRPRLDNAAYQGAQAGMRYLFPYVDYRVMDYAVSIPRRLYVGQNSSRKIFREAFRDIMPKSLYDVHYKDLASIRDLPRKDDQKKRFQYNISYLTEHLDREYWKDILDFDAIAAMELTGAHRSREESARKALVATLYRAVLIQDMVKISQNWRQAEDENETI